MKTAVLLVCCAATFFLPMIQALLFVSAADDMNRHIRKLHFLDYLNASQIEASFLRIILRFVFQVSLPVGENLEAYRQ